MRFTMKLLLLLASLLFLVNATTVSPRSSNALVGDEESVVNTGISPSDPGTPSSTILAFNARDDDGTVFTAAKKRCAICNAFVSDCVRNGHKSFEYCRDEQCKANLYFCGGCKYMPCKQPTFKSRDHPDANLHDSKFKWTQWRPIGLPYGNTERSALPPTTIESDDPTTEVKARDDSKATWDSRHVIGLPVARNLPATEHDPSIPDMPIEGEDDVAKIRRCKRKCRYVLDGCKKVKDNKEMLECMKTNCKGCGTCKDCFGHN